MCIRDSDTLDRERFFQITRRDELPNVLETMDTLLRHDIAVKINAVVMDGQNTDDLIPLAKMAQNLPVDVRFIEEMPFTMLYQNQYVHAFRSDLKGFAFHPVWYVDLFSLSK